MRRMLFTFVGLVLLGVGAFALASGSVLLAVFGRAGTTSTPPVRVTSTGGALVMDVDRLDAGLPDALPRGTQTITVAGLSDAPVFIGLGSAADVRTALAGSTIDVIEGIDGRQTDLQLRTTRGDSVAAAPTSQTFWTAQSVGSGNQSVVRLDGSPGGLVVVMNAGGSMPVDVRLTTSVDRPWAPAAGASAAAGGAALVIAGILMVVAGRRPNSKRLGAGERPRQRSKGEPTQPAGGTNTDDETVSVADAMARAGIGQGRTWGAPIAPSDRHVPVRSSWGSDNSPASVGNVGPLPTRTVQVDTDSPGRTIDVRELVPDAPPRQADPVAGR